MNGAMDIGAVALRAQQRALDTIANNVANVNTPTYKRVDSSFSEVMGRQIQPASQTALLASRELLPAGGVLAHPARPEPIDEHPGAVLRAGRLVGTLEFDVASGDSRAHRFTPG